MDTFTLTLTSQEKVYLDALVDTDLRETRVELRRTTNPDLHSELHKREEMIRGLLAKIKTAHQGDGAESTRPQPASERTVR